MYVYLYTHPHNIGSNNSPVVYFAAFSISLFIYIYLHIYAIWMLYFLFCIQYVCICSNSISKNIATCVFIHIMDFYVHIISCIYISSTVSVATFRIPITIVLGKSVKNVKGTERLKKTSGPHKAELSSYLRKKKQNSTIFCSYWFVQLFVVLLLHVCVFHMQR